MSSLPLPDVPVRSSSDARHTSRSSPFPSLPLPPVLPVPGTQTLPPSSLASSLPLPPMASGLPASGLPTSGPALPQPQVAGPSILQQKDDIIRALKQSCDETNMALNQMAKSFTTASNSLEKAKQELEQQQEEVESLKQRHKEEFAALEQSSASKEAALTSNREIWQNHAIDIQAQLEQKKGELDATKAQLAAAQQHLKEVPQIKTEDDELEQKLQASQTKAAEFETQIKALQNDLAAAEEAQNELDKLQTQVKALENDLAAAKEAQKHYNRSQEAERAAKSELQASEKQRKELQAKYDHKVQEFARSFEDCKLEVAKYAKQYIQDLGEKERQIQALKQEMGPKDDGRGAHKRPRDSSHGRDSKRRH